MRAAQATASVFAGSQAAALQPPLDLWEAIAFCGYVSWANGTMIEELLPVRVHPRKHEVMTNRHTCRTCARRALQKLGFPEVHIARGRNRDPT
jgi:hypothetical protein